MNLNLVREDLNATPAAAYLYDLLENIAGKLKLSDAYVFSQFPIYKELDGGIVRASFLLISKYHGMIAFGLTVDDGRDGIAEYQKQDDQLDNLISSLFSRAIRNKALRENRMTLRIPLESCIFAPSLDPSLAVQYQQEIESHLICNETELESFITERNKVEIEEETFQEIIATIDGSKGLIRPKERDVSVSTSGTKGYQVLQLETEIAVFDKKQRHGYTVPMQGPQRIRGLAGSGKTVILAMKAAQTHLEFPDAKILFTFYTKSLYQHVKRLITRFYRQFDEKDPNWNNLHVLHAWGGRSIQGVYYNACHSHGVQPLPLREAISGASAKGKRPFEYACEQLVEQSDIHPMYDFAFIDEGQDFSATFINLCRLLTKKERIVWAYDELQNIFDVRTPTAADVFGVDKDGNPHSAIKSDIVLHKCYRNPSEIIVVAHAMGFGLYGDHIVQMLESQGHWEDLGYEIVQGNCTPNSKMEINRPQGNSPISISESYSIDEIVQCESFDAPAKEIRWVCESIKKDLDEGLRPDDILIICVDDRNFKLYSRQITRILQDMDIGIMCNNTQTDPFGLVEFQQSGHVTISTIHKAKGNESYSVYIVGVDALFQYPGIISRNRLFTAMTRAKAWVQITGVGDKAEICELELSKAKANFPNMKFNYPGAEQIKIMKRDLAGSALRQQKVEKMLDEIMATMTAEEIQERVTKRQKIAKKEFRDADF